MSDMSRISRREAAAATLLGAIAVALPSTAEAKSASDGNASLKALVAAHHKAFNAQNLDGVLALMAPGVVLMGTAPGELWAGHQEVADAYKHFFTLFDPGKQSVETQWTHAQVGVDLASVLAVAKVTVTKGSDKRVFGLNMSMVCEKHGEKWLLSSLHLSNLAAPEKA